MIEVEQSNADKHESRVFRRDSRPRSFNNLHWTPPPQRNFYPQRNGCHTRPRNNYGRGPLRTSHLVSSRHQQQAQEDTRDPLPRKNPFTGRRPSFLIGPQEPTFSTRPFYRYRPRKAPTPDKSLRKVTINQEVSLPQEGPADLPKEPPKEPLVAPAPQSSDLQPKKIVEPQFQTTIYRNREQTRNKNAHLPIIQIEGLHFYNISTKMEIRRLEHQTRTLIKEAKDTQELFKTLEQDDGPSQPDEPPNSKLLCNIAYEILIKYSTEEAEGLSHFLKQLQATKGKEEVHLEALENVQISDWDHYLTALQKINTQQTTDLNALSFQADSLPLGGAGPLLHGLIRNCFTETQEEEKDLYTIRNLPSSLGQTLQHQLEQSFKRKQFLIRNIPLWLEPLQKEQRITKDEMGQLLAAFPYLMKLKYAFQTEEGKERTENPEKPSTSQSRGPLFFLNNITQLLFSRNQTGRKLLQAWDRSFYQEFYDTTSYGLQDRIRKLEKLFQGEKGLINNPRRLKRPKTLCHRTLEKLGFWTLVEQEPPLLSSDSKIAYWALINYCRLEQQDLSEARTKIMKSRGSQNSYVQESILAVNNLNRQIIQLQMGINELVRFPTIAQYLMLPLDQREESLIKGCVKRQGNYFLLLDYDPTTEEDLFFNTMSLIMATPRFPPDLFEILGIETKSYTPSSIYCQEPAYSRDQDGSTNSEETPGTREEDSSKDPPQEVEDWTEEERQPDYQPPASKEEAEEDEKSPFHEEDANKDPEPEPEAGVGS